MDNIASNFKIASSEPDGFRGTVRSVGPDRRGFIIAAVVCLCVVYYFRQYFLSLAKSIRSGGIADRIWSALYLTSKGEVATTFIPETSSVASALL